MPGNSFGTIFKITTFGESHGKAMGCVVDGCPAGLSLCAKDITKELRRRRPGTEETLTGSRTELTGSRTELISSRAEKDNAQILSGIFKGKTLGTPIAIIVKNNGQKPEDYDELKNLYRPGHADWSWEAKYGLRDTRGGGRSSGRETVSRVAAGAVAKIFLAGYGITFNSWTESAGNKNANGKPETLKAQGDSTGCIAACRISGVPAGLGEPVFDKLGALLGHALLSVGACKGIEFGAGFAAASSTGSANNDAPVLPPGTPAADGGYTANNTAAKTGATFSTNNSGGMLGGISNGMDIFFRAAFKPPPSISAEQHTIDRRGNPVHIAIHGRHDLCLSPRILSVVEAMAALTLADLLLLNRCAAV